MATLLEVRLNVRRFLIEPGVFRQLSELTPESDVVIRHLVVVPGSAQWGLNGTPGHVTLYIGDRPEFEAPVEALRVAYERYRGGHEPFFRAIRVPRRQTIGIRYDGNGSTASILVDLYIKFEREVWW